MSRVKITVDMLDEARPVARGGLMLIDLTCDMTTAQMFQAIQSMHEKITGPKWQEWLGKWAEEAGNYAIMDKEYALVVCPECGGDGKETCTNPDHGFINAIGGETARIGCPGCGHDPDHKVPGGGPCLLCEGSGKVTAEASREYIGAEEFPHIAKPE